MFGIQMQFQDTVQHCVAKTGDERRGVVKSFEIISRETMAIELRKEDGARLAPIISAIEIVLNEAQLAQVNPS